MYLLLSGEGPSDLGVCELGSHECDGEAFKPGPMAWMVDQWVEKCQGYEFSCLESGLVRYIGKQQLARNKQPVKGKRLRTMPGKKRPKETGYFFHNAKTLAVKAKELGNELGQTVVAVLFRDSDGTVSAGRGDWREKFNSMQKGFEDESFEHGVAMMPKPKSEAWLLCALKKDAPYQHCDALEDESGNDRAPYPLKTQLTDALGYTASSAQLAEMVEKRVVDIHQINMPSMIAFKESVEKAIRCALADS